MRHRPIDLQVLHLFVTTAEERNMSAAALRLGTTQSAVSQGIRQLEEELGVVLFDRKRRPLQLTPAALTLLNRGRALLAEGAQLRSEVLEASMGIAPEVSIGLVDSFAATCGPAFIGQMLHKTLRLAVRTGLSPHLGEELLTRGFDIVVTTDPYEGLEACVDRLVYTEPFIVLTPRASRLPAAASFDRALLRQLASAGPLVRFNAGSHLGTQVETLLRRQAVRATSRLEVDTADTLVAMVAAGFGWALTTPSCLLQGAAHAPGVQAGLLDVPLAERSIHLVGRRGEHERLFEAAWEAALQAVREGLLPGVRRLVPAAADRMRLASQAS
jgi:DNA-binding transcriptional LysR family regulator